MNKEKNKVVLLAVGVSDYLSEAFENLEVAKKDAILVFNTFHKVLGEKLDIINSTAKKDLRADEFLAILKNCLSQDDNNNGIFILYFSGHAKIYNKSLELIFKDADAKNSNGTVSISEIKRIIELSGLQAIIILDCCYASAGKLLTQSQDSLDRGRISLIASSKEYEPSRYTDELSLFTSFLIASINKLEALGKKISLAEIMSQLKLDWPIGEEQNPSLFHQEGEADVIIKEAFFRKGEKPKIVSDFINELATLPEKERELLWYAISEEKEGLLLEAISQLVSTPKLETSWLVRRSVGSALNKVTSLKAEKAKVCIDLIKSKNWSMNIIGIIGGKNSLEGDPALQSGYFQALSSGAPMDLKWLAFLYLCDAGLLDDKNIDFFEQTDLLSTGWGVCEYWHRYCHSAHNDFLITRTKELLRTCKSDNICSTLIKYIYRYSKNYEELSTVCNIKNGSIPRQAKDFLDIFKEKATRGKTESLGIRKWLYSRLYGGWRGEHERFIVHYINQLTTDDARDFLLYSANNPDVAGRMAIFDQIKTDIRLLKTYVGDLSWGVEDPHPWVRRSAVNSFISGLQNGLEINAYTTIEKSLTPFSRNMYPGSLDLFISTTKLAGMASISMEDYQQLTETAFKILSRSEIDALNREFKSEALPYEIPDSN